MSDRTRGVDEFLEEVASDRVTPAGGTATAVVGATGAALCELVCVHAAGRDADAAVTLAETREDLRTQRSHLLDLAEADAGVVEAMFVESDGPPGQRLVKRSIGVPLTTADACLSVVELAEVVTANARGESIADAAMGTMHAHTALRASVFTVRYNLTHVSDGRFADSVAARATALEEAAAAASERVLAEFD